MTTYVVLFRGINVGGRNKVPMPALREHLETDFTNVRTYIQSGNVLLDSDLPADQVAARIDAGLPSAFALDSDLVRVLVLDEGAYREVVTGAPKGFGDDPDRHRHDVIFYMATSGPCGTPDAGSTPRTPSIADPGEQGVRDHVRMDDQLEAAVETYLSAVREADVERVLSLFAPDAVVHSPLYGVMAPTEFYPTLFADTSEANLELRSVMRVVADAIESPASAIANL